MTDARQAKRPQELVTNWRSIADKLYAEKLDSEWHRAVAGTYKTAAADLEERIFEPDLDALVNIIADMTYRMPYRDPEIMAAIRKILEDRLG